MVEHNDVMSVRVSCCSDSLEAIGGGVWSQDPLSLAHFSLVQRVGVLDSVLPQLRPHRMTPLTKPVVRQNTPSHNAINICMKLHWDYKSVWRDLCCFSTYVFFEHMLV